MGFYVFVNGEGASLPSLTGASELSDGRSGKFRDEWAGKRNVGKANEPLRQRGDQRQYASGRQSTRYRSLGADRIGSSHGVGQPRRSRRDARGAASQLASLDDFPGRSHRGARNAGAAF